MRKSLEQLDILNSKVWIEDGRWIQPVLSWMTFAYWNRVETTKRMVPGLDLRTIFSLDGYAFQHAQTHKALYDYLAKCQKENSLKELVVRIDHEGNESSQNLFDILKNDDVYIAENFAEIMHRYQEFIGVWTLATLAGDRMSVLAKDSGYVAVEADLFARVHPYLRDTWIEEEVHDIRAIAEKYLQKYPNAAVADLASCVAQDQELSVLLEKYITKFVWSRISKWIGEPVDMAHALKRLGEEIVNIQKGNNIQHQKKNPSDDGFDGVVALCVCSAYWRAQSARVDMILAHRMRSIMNDVAEKNGLNYRQTLFLGPKELVEVLSNSNKIVTNKAALLEREKMFFNTLSDDGEEIVLTAADPEFTEIMNAHLKSHQGMSERPAVLKGIGASKGKVSGSVRVVDSEKQFGDFKEGEILVAAETSPTFVPLMRMSAAILTGRGGITSHAAIVSRELGKPCIIAVKDITRILKTGDMVEVDANTGVVKIILK